MCRAVSFVIHELTFGPVQVKHKSKGETSKQISTAATSQQCTEESQSGQCQLSDTEAALRHAMQQLEELTADSEMRDVHAKLEQQSQALQTMQESFEAVEAEKAEEHEQTLSR